MTKKFVISAEKFASMVKSWPEGEAAFEPIKLIRRNAATPVSFTLFFLLIRYAMRTLKVYTILLYFLLLRVYVLKVGEGIIANGKKVWTAVLADAVEQQIARFKGQQHRSTSRMEKFSLKCPSHDAYYTVQIRLMHTRTKFPEIPKFFVQFFYFLLPSTHLINIHKNASSHFHKGSVPIVCHALGGGGSAICDSQY